MRSRKLSLSTYTLSGRHYSSIPSQSLLSLICVIRGLWAIVDLLSFCGIDKTGSCSHMSYLSTPVPYRILLLWLHNLKKPLGDGTYSLVFAKNISASKYFAGVLTKDSTLRGILGKNRRVLEYNQYWKQKYPGNSIYSTEQEKYGQTTVTIKKPQVTINSNPLSYFTNFFSKANPQTAKKSEKSHCKKAQPYRLSDWLDAGQISRPQFTVQQFLCCAVFPHHNPRCRDSGGKRERCQRN